MPSPLKKIRQISGQSKLNFNTSAMSGKLIVGAAGTYCVHIGLVIADYRV